MRLRNLSRITALLFAFPSLALSQAPSTAPEDSQPQETLGTVLSIHQTTLIVKVVDPSRQRRQVEFQTRNPTELATVSTGDIADVVYTPVSGKNWIVHLAITRAPEPGPSSGSPPEPGGTSSIVPAMPKREKPTLAVLLPNPQSVGSASAAAAYDPQLAQLFSDQLSLRLAGQYDVKYFTPDEVSKALSTEHVQFADLNDPTIAARFSRELGVDNLVIGHVSLTSHPTSGPFMAGMTSRHALLGRNGRVSPTPPGESTTLRSEVQLQVKLIPATTGYVSAVASGTGNAPARTNPENAVRETAMQEAAMDAALSLSLQATAPPSPSIPATSMPAASAQAANGTPVNLIGKSEKEVTQALGSPKSVVDLETKKIYVYPDRKVVFVSGKVTEVE